MIDSDVIYNVLEEVYDPFGTSKYAQSVNDDLAKRIYEYLENGHTVRGTKSAITGKPFTHHYSPSRREVINMIWMPWSGGGVAEYAADKILSALSLDLPEHSVITEAK